MASLLRRSRLDDDLWDELEELLISADVGVALTERIIKRVRTEAGSRRVSEADEVLEALKEEMVDILTPASDDDPLESRKTPLVLLVVGVNGVGKTTSIAKLARGYADDGKRVVLGAGDTYRAAAIDQLQAWGRRLDIDVIAHSPGADSGAVAFDTYRAARARKADVAIIDTAGRMHTRGNLMAELRKVHSVLARQTDGDAQRVLLTLDATIGQNGLAQARAFTETVRCDGVFLAKLDGTARGGIVLAVAHELKLPILFIGTGEQPDDVAPFHPREFVDALFASNDAG
jgi:fused signal recognition particle receptor